MNSNGKPPELGVYDLFEAFFGSGDLAEEDFPATRSKKPSGRPKGSVGPRAQAIRAATLELAERFDRMTVRQVFYQLETAGIVEKTEAGYHQVQKQLVPMRREGLLPWEFITDGTRWQRKPNSFTDAKDYIKSISRSYRRDLWQGQGVRIEVWLEKDALADVITDKTVEWDVSLMVSRGQSSVTFLHSAAMAAEAAYARAGLETHIYALYDFDAGGERAFRTIESDLPEFAPDTPIHVNRLAVTEAQIAQWSLPTRPPKKSDPQAAKWGNKPAVELDAIDPTSLTQLVENAIEGHVDKHAWKVQQVIEVQERQGFGDLARWLE